MEYLHVYSGQYSLNRIAKEERRLFSKFIESCNSLEEVKNKIRMLKCFVTDEFSDILAKDMLQRLKEISEETFDEYKATRIWPISIWVNNEEFEDECMMLMENIARVSADRQQCINQTQEIFDIFSCREDEKLLEIIIRVLHEFCIATDEEFNELKKVL